MITHLSYKDALAAPRVKRIGWKNAEPDSLLASLSEIMGNTMCLRGEAIYDWALDHSVDYATLMPLRGDPDRLTAAVLNGVSLEKADKLLGRI
jgi:hypothetical protein